MQQAQLYDQHQPEKKAEMTGQFVQVVSALESEAKFFKSNKHIFAAKKCLCIIMWN